MRSPPRRSRRVTRSRRSSECPTRDCVIGTSFSLGLGVGLFMSGANRLLVLLALAPAAAMAATLVARDEGPAAASR